jgi:hypothetical protein
MTKPTSAVVSRKMSSENTIADSLAAELGSDRPLTARLVASSLVATLGVIEETAAERMEHEDRPLGRAEIAALLDDAVAFAEAGMSTLRDR